MLRWMIILVAAGISLNAAESLDRGLVALRSRTEQVFLSWRWLARDAGEIEFDVYRKSDGDAAIKLNRARLNSATHFIDLNPVLGKSSAYFVTALLNGKEIERTS